MATNNSSDYSPTQYNVQTGGANGTLNNVPPSTSGYVLTSNGGTSQPTFQAAASSNLTFDGDTGSATPSANVITIHAGTASQHCGSSVSFSNASSTSLLNVTDQNGNIIIGTSAGNASNTGSINVSLGNNSLTSLTSGQYNVGIGTACFGDLTSGTRNVAVGYASIGNLTTGQYNIGIGINSAGNYASSESSNIMIGNPGVVSESNTIRIGNQGSGLYEQNSCYIAGIEGVSVSNLNYVTINTATGQLGSTASVASSITVTGDSGGGLTGNSFTFTGGATGLTFSGASTTETLIGTLVTGHGGTGLTATPGNSTLLATNSSGTLAYRSFSTKDQVFTSSGTYTPTTGMLYCKIIAIGGGGGGGGAPSTSGSGTNGAAGTGGGGGETAIGIFSASTIGASQSVTIGTGGSTSSGSAGGSGGTTSVGSTLISAVGGTGGFAPAASSAGQNGGALGGTGGTGGDYRFQGGSGGGCFWTGSNVGPVLSGAGGNSYFGNGGPQVGANGAGVAGTGYGAGGSGAAHQINVAAQAGGAGSAGIVVIQEYIIN